MPAPCRPGRGGARPWTRAPRGVVAVLVAAAAVAGAREAEVRREIVYVESPSDPAHQSLDLYLPGAEPAPLVIFFHSRFWREVWEPRWLDAHFARPLQAQGAAVAVVRHRLAPRHRHPTHAEDAAAAVAFLLGRAGEYGIDRERVFLAGHSSGAHLAALLALDAAYLGARGVEAGAIAGVIGFSGIYDLDPEEGAVSDTERGFYADAFGKASTRRAASPLRLARADAPPFLLLAARDDIPGTLEGTRAFAEALAAKGHDDARALSGIDRDHRTILDLTESEMGVPVHVTSFVGVAELPGKLAALEAATRYWRDPRFSTEPFWERGVPVKSYPADERFVAESRRLFVGQRRKRAGWSPDRFHAVDLYAYLEARGDEVGRGPWLTLTNVQMEKTYLHLGRIRDLRPVVVIGIDDERNLFTITDFHWAEREYSWTGEEERPPPSARPMGAFLYFLEPPEEPVLPPMLGHFSLVEKSFARSREDPLAPLRGLDDGLFAVLTVRNGCVHCHRFRGVGTNAGHLRAVDAAFQGGFALPLVKYPPEVWRRFVFEPEKAAAMIGTSMNRVEPPLDRALFELVENERAAAASD